MASQAPTSARRKWLVLVGSLLAVPLIAEVLLRWALFGGGSVALAVGADLRSAGLFADPDSDEDYWRLTARFDPELVEQIDEQVVPDPILGWRNPELFDEHFDHALMPHLGDRRPVLFFGASFVKVEYSALIDASPLSPSHGLLTYGVGGFGLGQTAILAEAVAPRYVDHRPIAILAVVIDADLPRASMGLREGTKPAFTLGADGTIQRDSFEPGTLGSVAQREHPAIASYLWAWLTGSSSPLPGARSAVDRRRTERLQSAVALNLALIDRVRSATESADGELIVALFNGPRSLEGDRAPAERALIEGLDRLGIAYVDSRPLFDAARAAGHHPRSFFHGSGHVEQDHPNELGRALIAGFLVEAIGGHRDGSSAEGAPYAALVRRMLGSAPAGD